MNRALVRSFTHLSAAALLALASGCTTVPAPAPVLERVVPPSVDARSVRLPLVEPTGALFAGVTQASISTTICKPGWTATVRPSTSFTQGVKLKFLREAGLDPDRAADYELDHFVPLALGGHPLTVTHTDGYPVEPVEVDALLIGMGERYDIIIQPRSGAWPLVALAEGKNATAAAVVRTSDAGASASPPPDVRPAELDGGLLHYTDLRATEAARLAVRRPDVDETIKLTGSMMPYSWAFDAKPFPDRSPIDIRQGQRVRLAFQNTTSMWHPVHLHGHTFRLGDQAEGARKDTVSVLPNQTVVVEFDADNPGQWMAHCHNSYHLERGMAMILAYVP